MSPIPRHRLHILLVACTAIGCGFRPIVEDGGAPGVPDLSVFAKEGDRGMTDPSAVDLGAADLSGVNPSGQLPDLGPIAPPVDLTPPSGWTLGSSGVVDDLIGVGGFAGDVIAVGQKGRILRSTDHGVAWTPITNPTGMAMLNAVWGNPGGTGITLAGDLAHILYATSGADAFTGQTTPSVGFLLWGLWGSAANNLFAVGFSPASATTTFGILHSTGDGSWTEVSPVVAGGFAKAFGVWGSSASDVYAVGDHSSIVHSSGDPAVWTPLTTVGTAIYAGVWGSGPNDIYVVGDSGTILHSTGGAFTPQTSGVLVDLNAVWGSSATDVYVVGRSGTVLHSSDGGDHWLQQPTSVGAALYGIWGSSAFDVHVVGQGGTVLHKP